MTAQLSAGSRAPSDRAVRQHLQPRLAPAPPGRGWPRGVPLPIGITGVTYQPGAGVQIDGRRLAATHRRMSDLLAAGSAWQPQRDRLVETVRTNGYDLVLYDAYRDILPPRPGAGSAQGWFADLVIYQPGVLANREPVRSLGHWNTPSQVEVFQCLTGTVLMLVAGARPDGSRFCREQICGPGGVAVVPVGAWHVTYVLDGPAAVLNLYADHPAGVGSSRHAALHPEIKYRRGQPPVQLAVQVTSTGPTVVGTRTAVRTFGAPQRAWPHRWLRPFLRDGDGLGDLFLHADDAALAALIDAAWRNR